MHGFAIALVMLVACKDDKDDAPTGETGEEDGALTVLGDDANLPPAALKSIWGTEDDMFIVGADDGTGPVVLHWDGSTWTRIDTSAYPGGLWWVWSLPGSDTVWIAGEGARMLTYSRASGTITGETVVAGSEYTLFGIWGSAENDIWTVGGDVNNNSEGVIVHWDGAAWIPSATAPSDDGVSKRQAFKVWGAAADDVWVTGTRALVMHWDGTDWEPLPQPVYESITLFTVSGTGPNDVYAVGGDGNARAVHWDGTAWADISPPPVDIVPGFIGVYASAEYGVVACGESGSIYWYQDGTWVADSRTAGTARDFHACWIDDAGAVWAVGGDLSSETEGAVVYGGEHVPPVAL